MCICMQVKLLIEVGGADPSLEDRWEQTPLDEARRIVATPVVEYLSGVVQGEYLCFAAFEEEFTVYWPAMRLAQEPHMV